MTRVASIALAAMTAGTAIAANWYVDANAPSGGNGQSWGTAFQSIQDALNVAVANDTIIVTNGVYEAISRTDNAAITIRSVNGPAVTTINGNGATRCATLGSAAGHTATVLSGFTLTNGNATASSPGIAYDGGGAYGGTLNNCVLTKNTARYGGGAAGGTQNNCILTGNTADHGGGSYRGTLTDCILIGNTADYNGGGACDCTLNTCTLSGNTASNSGGGAWGAMLIDCLLMGNTAYNSGGGAYYSTLNNCTLTGNTANYGGGAYGGTLNNCLLTDNIANLYGGGAYGSELYKCTLTANDADSGGGAYDCTLFNCLLTANTAYDGGGAYGGTLNNCTLSLNTALWYGGGVHGGTLYNSIVWGNIPSNTAGSPTLAYSCTTPSHAGTGNISADPRFMAPPNGDFRLRLDSPCINAGNNAYIASGITTDLDGNNRIAEGTVDMGAYEIPGTRMYVATTGNDANNGQTWTTAKKTIQGALTSAPAGSVVAVSNGTYGVISRTDNTRIIVQSVNGPSVTIINGNGTARCATLGTQATHTNLILSGLTLTNGYTTASGGGALYGTLNNCTLSGNTATYDGGGASWGTLNNCTLSGNTANQYDGGGASWSTLTDCTLSGNTANQYGGGAYGGTLSNCTLTGNTANNGGGAYYSTLNNCTLTGNSANYGGGAYDSTLTDCTLTGNSAYSGGGADRSTLTDCTLSGNTAEYGGGGAFRSTLTDCTLSGNTAEYGGGAYDSTLDNCTLSGNSATYDGGGAYGGTLTNCTLTGNTAANYGGGACDSTLNNCVITGNTANYYGGGAMSGTLNNCTLSGNTANQVGGGAYYGTLTDCILTGNTAGNEGGGAFYSTLNNCALTGNKANEGGGAFNSTLNNCALTGNTAGGGGGTFNSTLDNCTLSGNMANYYGGGAYGGTLNNCALSGNTAGDSGGGGASISALNNCTLTGNTALRGGGSYGSTLNNCTLTGNTALRGGGAACCTLRNCTVWGNTAPEGSGVYGFSSYLVWAYNTIVWGNTNSLGTVNNYTDFCAFANSCTSPLHAGTGNIADDPRLMDPAKGDFRLRLDSPGINAGDNTYVLPGMTTDLDGNPRIAGGTVDMGAYEAPGPFICVDQKNGDDSYTGRTWATAKKTIQGALTNVSPGGMIAVKDGTYDPITRTSNTSIIIQSVNGPSVTIINGGGTNRCAELGYQLGDTNTVLTGFTLTNGLTPIINFSFGNGGGALYGTLNNCILTGNSVSGGGGGGAYGSALNNCLLTGNTAGVGGGAHSATLRNCTVFGNTSSLANIGVGGVSGGTAYNSIVWGNFARGAAANYSGTAFTNSCTSPLPAGDGNIETNPKFVDAANGNFRLGFGSLCIDAGNSTFVVGTTDLDGNMRILGLRVDIGAYEFTKEWVGPPDVPVPVPFSWLNDYTGPFGVSDYVQLALTQGQNNVALWESYVARLDPLDPTSKFLIYVFETDGTHVNKLDWKPRHDDRVYTIYGKTNLTDTTPWFTPTNSGTRFFKVEVKLE